MRDREVHTGDKMQQQDTTLNMRSRSIAECRMRIRRPVVAIGMSDGSFPDERRARFVQNMQTYQFFIKHKENQPVKISTHFDSERKKREVPLEDVADLLASVKQALSSKLGAIDLDELTLHLPEGFSRSALDKDCFAGTDSTGTTLRTGLSLERLHGLGIDDLQPLVIKSNSLAGGSPTSLNTEQAIGKLAYLAGETIRSQDERILILHFPNYLRLLKLGKLDVEGARHLLRLLRTTLKSETIKSVGSTHKYIFGRSIDTGAGKAILQKVYSLETGKFLCAKLFMNIGTWVGSRYAVF